MYSKEEIDTAFRQLSAQVQSVTGNGTGCEDVLQFLYENPQKIWWMSWDFIGKQLKNGKILSHRAPARASDLAIHDSQLVESRKIGRYSAYRLRTEYKALIKARLHTTEEQPEDRQKVLPEKCEHGLPKFVQCPKCIKNHD